jgi:hypothetical protein
LARKLIDKPHHGNFWAKCLEKVRAKIKVEVALERKSRYPRHSHIRTMSMITAAQWVPRGFAAQFPQIYKLDESEFERIAGLAKLQLDDAEEDLKEAQEDGEDVEEENESNDEEMGEKVEKVEKVKKQKKTKTTVKYVLPAFMSLLSVVRPCLLTD